MLTSNSLDPAFETGSAHDATTQAGSSLSLAERRARALGPTVFCPPWKVEQCIERAVLTGNSP
jgi:hypothetical protein